MPIPYYLLDNPLTPDPKDFRAQLQLKGTKKRIDIVKRIMIKNSGLAESELIAVFDEERRAIEEFLEDGYGVDTGLVLIKPGVKGVFNSATEVFTPGKHELKINVSALKALKPQSIKGFAFISIPPNATSRRIRIETTNPNRNISRSQNS